MLTNSRRQCIWSLFSNLDQPLEWLSISLLSPSHSRLKMVIHFKHSYIICTITYVPFSTFQNTPGHSKPFVIITEQSYFNFKIPLNFITISGSEFSSHFSDTSLVTYNFRFHSLYNSKYLFISTTIGFQLFSVYSLAV